MTFFFRMFLIFSVGIVPDSFYKYLEYRIQVRYEDEEYEE